MWVNAIWFWTRGFFFLRANRNYMYVFTEYVLNENDCIAFLQPLFMPLIGPSEMALFRENFLYAGVAWSYWSSPCPISLCFFVRLFVFFCRIALPTIVTDRSKTCRQMWSSCLRTQERTTWKPLWSVCVCVCVCVCVRERRKIELMAWVKKCPFPSTGSEPVPLGYAPMVLPITPQGRHALRQSKQTLQLLSAGPRRQASARTSAELDEACQRKTKLKR